MLSCYSNYMFEFFFFFFSFQDPKAPPGQATEGMLANFFNSLLNKKTGAAVAGKGTNIFSKMLLLYACSMNPSQRKKGLFEYIRIPNKSILGQSQISRSKFFLGACVLRS